MEAKTKLEQYGLKKSGERWIGLGFAGFVASMLPIALGSGWEQVTPLQIVVFWALRVVSLFVFLWGHVLLCDAKNRSRWLASMAVLGILGTDLLCIVLAINPRGKQGPV